MTKVSDMLGDFAHPAGDSGRDVDQEKALHIAIGMRVVLNSDLSEELLAQSIQIINREMDQESMIAAWELLNAGERAAWKRYCHYEEWLKEQLRARD